MRGSAKRAKVVPAPVVPDRQGITKPKHPSQCRTYIRKVLVQEFPGIVEGFVKEAAAGSCQHVKLATELLQAKRPEGKPRRRRNSLDRWMDQMEREG